MAQQTQPSSSSFDQAKVAIVVLNWNGAKDTVECLESIYQNTYSAFEVVLVDNGSKVDSIQRIEAYVNGKEPVQSKFFTYNPNNKPLRLIRPAKQKISLQFNGELILIENPANLGFALGTNVGIQIAQKQQADYIMLLNNDIVVEKNFLAELVDYAEANPDVGVAGPTIYYYSRPDVVDFAGENLTKWRVKGKEFTTPSKQPREVDKIEGSCMLIRRAVLDKVGLLYPGYWAYWEETDLCFRAKKAGYRVAYVPTSRIWHKVAGSTGGEGNLRREYFLNRNRLLFARRNLSWGDQAKFLLYFFGFELWLKTAVELKHHSKAGAFMWLRAAYDGLKLYLNPTNKP